jgi:hypothetical protein
MKIEARFSSTWEPGADLALLPSRSRVICQQVVVIKWDWSMRPIKSGRDGAGASPAGFLH